MKFKSLFLKSMLCLTLGLPGVLSHSSALHADAEDINQKIVSPHQFEVTPEIFAYSYKEWVYKKPFMSLKGPMFGLGGTYTYNFGKNFVKFASRFAIGNGKYKSNGTGKKNFNPSCYVDSQALYGRHFDFSSNVTISPYLGLGYRYLITPPTRTRTTTGHSDYLRQSHYLYIPIGSDLTIPIDSKLSFVANAEYDVFLKGLQKSHLGSYYGGTHNNKQSRGYGLKTAAGLRWDLEKSPLKRNLFFAIGPLLIQKLHVKLEV
ncbi:MAG: hypothetical protein Q8S31_07350 [Alphaproteobacteria bacterium]|nr:hypothetical protein [Alphaproteobacteria bacterium]